jgi:hypothetical protein
MGEVVLMDIALVVIVMKRQHQIWDDWMLNSPYTCSTFADWYLVNFQEMSSLLNMNETYGLNGYPFNIPVSTLK